MGIQISISYKLKSTVEQFLMARLHGQLQLSAVGHGHGQEEETTATQRGLSDFPLLNNTATAA